MVSSKNKIYLVLILWIIIFGVLLKFGIFSLVKELNRTSEEFVFQKKALELFQLRVEDFKNFQGNYSFYQTILKKIENSFVNQEAPIDFIKFLEKEAENLNLSKEISPLNIPQRETDIWLPVAFSVTLGGPFSDCLKFLERLEQSHWLIEISQLNIKRVEEEKGKQKFEGLSLGEVTFAITLKTFSSEKVED